LRPKWSTLYHARKEQSDAARRLPELPNTFFGWIPVVAGISQEEVLASAGLDAFAFLSFFRYAIKYLAIIWFFSVSVILPVNSRYTGDALFPGMERGNKTHEEAFSPLYTLEDDDKKRPKFQEDNSYLWMYVAFAYLFTAIAIFLLIRETKHIIRIRQAYLGTQATVTDRTIRLSGIPVDMRSEAQIKDFIEDLGIGKVDSVMLCRNWKKLDDLMSERMQHLRKLEKAWTAYLGHHHSLKHTRHRHRRRHGNGNGNGNSDAHEAASLMSDSEMESAHAHTVDRERPQHTIRYGPLRLQSKRVDAIDYWEEKLRRIDERIKTLRNEEFKPTPLAFVTMESTAACQMAIQAILDPNPGTFIASLAPPPVDVVWKNTYLSRNSRMLRSWTIMIGIGFLTIFWAVLLLPLAGLLSIDVIDKVLPGLADILEAHHLAKSLVSTSLTTLVYSLLTIGVSYLYDWFANQQGMTSQGDVELSVISKNFFFVFFNLFIVFTIFGSATTFFEFWQEFKEIIRDTGAIANAIAKSLEQLSPFYTNLIVLQGLGLFPFRLLEFGTVALYPFYLLTAATPRDYAELAAPPVFSYGFFLPQSMLIFLICTVYSLLPASWTIILFGLVYFVIGHFIYKYQLLYAMEHRQQSTGRAWPMICNRIILGLVIFQLAMTGVLVLKRAFTASLFQAPLIVATIWFTVYFQRTYFPLMWFIALRSIDKPPPPPLPTPSENPWSRDTDNGRLIDDSEATGVRYVNPNLVIPLETMWVRKPGQVDTDGAADGIESGVV
jgi:calcium permeable stress-gated cation channel